MSFTYPIVSGKLLGPPVVSISDLTKRYDIGNREEPVVALTSINLSENSEFPPIRAGEFVMIRGPSGGGKTTLLNIIGGLDLPSAGKVTIMGHTILPTSSDSELSVLRLRHIGFVFQTFNLIATMSAYENVELPMTLAGVPRAERRARALHLLRAVGLRDRANHLPSEMSGGEQQRTTIARALANDPTVLLLDEPTGDLDTLTTVDIMALLADLNIAQRVTCIMVTHNPDLEPYADRIIYVQDGTVSHQVRPVGASDSPFMPSCMGAPSYRCAALAAAAVPVPVPFSPCAVSAVRPFPSLTPGV